MSQFAAELESVFAKRIAILEEVTSKGSRDSIGFAVVQLALLDTEKLIQLLEKKAIDSEWQEFIILSIAFFSQDGKACKARLIELLPDMEKKICEAFEDTQSLDPLLQELPPLRKAITDALEWRTDDSGD